MTQLVLNIENPSILPSLKKVLCALDGVSIAKPTRKAKRKTELDSAIEEVRRGEITRWESVDELLRHIQSIDK